MFVIGTAGHVNHGKTTLVHALTGVDTDRLEEEKRRGMTIELGFAPLALPDGARGSLVDVPGHRRFVPTMIAGASGIDLVLLVVAADEGVMPQTREHVAICKLLGLDRAVVALTKTDRVDDETCALAASEVASLLDAEIVPCAPKTGAGLDDLRAALTRALAGRDARARGAANLWVDRVFHVHGAGTVVTGTLTRGRLARGDRIAIGGRAGAVRGLQVHGEAVDDVTAPSRVAVNLTVDAARGELLTAENDAPPLTSLVDVSVRGAAFRRGATATFHVGTASSAAKITRLDPLATDVTLARLVLATPLPIRAGERHLLRSGRLLGGGVVLDARPAPLRPALRRRLATAIHARDASAALDLLLDASAPRPFDRATVALAVPLEVDRNDLAVCGSGVIRRTTLRGLAADARRLVTEHHARLPLDRGLPLASLREELGRRAGPAAADAAILLARARSGPDDGGAIAIEGDVAVSAARSTRLPPAIAASLEEVKTRLVAGGVHGVSSGNLTETLGLPAADARSVLAALEREGVAVHAGELWFARAVVDAVREAVVAHLRTGASISVIEAKALCGLPRRQAIVLLEHFDAAGLTRRVGDRRVLA